MKILMAIALYCTRKKNNIALLVKSSVMSFKFDVLYPVKTLVWKIVCP